MQQAEHRLRVIKLLLVAQTLGACLAGLVGLLFGQNAALCALLGGLTVLLPNSYFAIRAFKYRGARAAKLIVRSFYAGAAGKMVLTATMFMLVFVYVRPLNAIAVFSGYLAVQMLNWLVPLLIRDQRKGPRSA